MNSFLIGGCILLVLWNSCLCGEYPFFYYDEVPLKKVPPKHEVMVDYESYTLPEQQQPCHKCTEEEHMVQGAKYYLLWLDKGFNKISNEVKKAGYGIKKRFKNKLGPKDHKKVIEGSKKGNPKVIYEPKKAINEVKEIVQKIIDRLKTTTKKAIDNFDSTAKAVKNPVTDLLSNIESTADIVKNVVNTVKCLSIVDRLNTTLRFDINNNDANLNAEMHELLQNEEIIHDEVDYILDNAVYIKDKMDKVIKLQGTLRFG